MRWAHYYCMNRNVISDCRNVSPAQLGPPSELQTVGPATENAECAALLTRYIQLVTTMMC